MFQKDKIVVQIVKISKLVGVKKHFYLLYASNTTENGLLTSKIMKIELLGLSLWFFEVIFPIYANCSVHFWTILAIIWPRADQRWKWVPKTLKKKSVHFLYWRQCLEWKFWKSGNIKHTIIWGLPCKKSGKKSV